MKKTKKTKQIATITPIEPKIVDNSLDLDKLKNDMVKGLYSLESTLYQQSILEQKRITKLRKCIETLEDRIFDEAFLDTLEPKDKLYLYKLSSNNMTDLMDFLMSLHKTVADGANVLTQIQTMKNQSYSESTKSNLSNMSDSEFKNTVQSMIKNKIVEKTKK